MEQFSKALNYCFLLLKYRARSKSEIISRLKKKGYKPPIISKVISYLQEYNYINDQEFTHNFVSFSLDKGWGPRRIDFNLKNLGISHELRKQALSGDISYKDKIRELVTNKLKIYKNRKEPFSKKVIYQKIVNFLVTKGFEYNEIFEQLENLGVSRFEEDKYK